MGDPAADSDDSDHDEHGDDADERATVDRPVRRGSVDLRTDAGEHRHHDEAFVRYDPDAFVVSVDPSFPPARTERHPKTDVAWIQVRHPRR